MKYTYFKVLEYLDSVQWIELTCFQNSPILQFLHEIRRPFPNKSKSKVCLRQFCGAKCHCHSPWCRPVSPSQSYGASLLQTPAVKTAVLHMERQSVRFHYFRMMTKCSHYTNSNFRRSLEIFWRRALKQIFLSASPVLLVCLLCLVSGGGSE